MPTQPSPQPLDPASVLGPSQRAAALERLGRDRFDIVVIGGGITGAGCALDAASRGLSVALIEKDDLAAGTSSRSSKLVHGGLRYLQRLDLKLVHEALRERSLLLGWLCPHLVEPLPFLYPLRRRVVDRLVIGSGIALYDVLARRSTNPLPRHRHLGRRRTRRAAPSLRSDRVVGSIRYWDAQVDDARLAVTVARTAAQHGAVIGLGVEATGFVWADDDPKRISGVRASVDESTGVRELVIEARQVINATGPWTDRVRSMAGSGSPTLRTSKGVHVVVAGDRISSDSALIARAGGSVILALPWGDHWIVGTTDTDWDLDPDEPLPNATDVATILERINGLVEPPICNEHVHGVFAGLRPLVHGGGTDTAKLSREHAVSVEAPGMVTVAGGKYTTYRVMAADAVDAAVDALGTPAPASRTVDIALVGAVGYHELVDHTQALGADVGLAEVDRRRLLRRYGIGIVELVDLMRTDPDLALPVSGGAPYRRAEIVYGCTDEGARTLDDILARRTRLHFETADRGLVAADEVAGLMADALGWDDATRARQVDAYRARVEAELRAEAT